MKIGGLVGGKKREGQWIRIHRRLWWVGGVCDFGAEAVCKMTKFKVVLAV